MYNPAGLSLVSSEKWIQHLALFLVISLIWMQIPALLRSDFFVNSSSPFSESDLRTKIGLNQAGGKTGADSYQNGLSVKVSNLASEITLAANSGSFAKIRVISLNYSGLELIVVENQQDFGELFVSYQSRLGFSALIPIRRSTGQKASFIRRDQDIQNKESTIERRDVFVATQKIKENSVLAHKLKVLVLLC